MLCSFFAFAASEEELIVEAEYDAEIVYSDYVTIIGETIFYSMIINTTLA